MLEFEVNGRNYRASKMDAMTQFNIIRRFAPIMESLGHYIAQSTGRNDGNIPERIDMAMPIIRAIADLPEETTDFVISTCMNLVKREEGEGRGWSKIWNEQAHRPQMDDIDMVTMLMIVVSVLGGSFSAFFPGSDWSSKIQPDGRSTLTQ